MIIRYPDIPEFGGKGGVRRRQIRFWLWGLQGGRCFWCERPLDRDNRRPSQRNRTTLDHLIPKSKGGGNGVWNLVLSCQDCNTDRRSRLGKGTIAWLKERRKLWTK